MSYLWNTYLLAPLFNLLIWLYYNYAFFNLGIAVIYLTIILRIVLLPLSIIGGKSKSFYKVLTREIKEIQNDYPNDSVKQRELVRELLHKRKIRPWASAITLIVQLIVLILLYQVFIHGIQGNYEYLYPSVINPEWIDTKFLWFDIGQRDIYISGIVGIVLFLEITLAQRSKKELLTKRELWFRLLFPLFSFAALAMLPAVKSIFILTSLLFSFIILILRNIIGRFYYRAKQAIKTQ